MCACTVSNDSHADLSCICTIFLLEGHVGVGVDAADAIAVEIVALVLSIEGLSARVNCGIEIVAIETAPIRASECGDCRMCITIQIDDGQMLISELVNKVLHPLPWGHVKIVHDVLCLSNFVFLLSWQEGERWVQVALFVVTHLDFATHNVCVVQFQVVVDDGRAEHIHDASACCLEFRGQPCAGLCNQVCDISLLVNGVVVQDLQNHSTHCTVLVAALQRFHLHEIRGRACL